MGMLTLSRLEVTAMLDWLRFILIETLGVIAMIVLWWLASDDDNKDPRELHR
jgi:hypothetical protein